MPISRRLLTLAVGGRLAGVTNATGYIGQIGAQNGLPGISNTTPADPPTKGNGDPRVRPYFILEPQAGTSTTEADLADTYVDLDWPFTVRAVAGDVHDLLALIDRIVTDLSTLVTPAGELIDPDADETSLGQESPLAAVERLNRELADVRAEMQDSMWFPRFRGMSSDDLVVFQEQHYPKKEGENLVGWQNQLVAASMIEPTVTVADVEKLRGTLGAQAMRKLIDTATEVNLRGGIDIPFSPSFSRPPTQR